MLDVVLLDQFRQRSDPTDDWQVGRALAGVIFHVPDCLNPGP
jgi:hypothetical protein